MRDGGTIAIEKGRITINFNTRELGKKRDNNELEVETTLETQKTYEHRFHPKIK